MRITVQDFAQMATDVRLVAEEDLGELLPLMRGYCDFYATDTSDEALMTIATTLIEEPENEGLQFLARDTGSGEALGFATVYWTWSTLRGGRIGVMNDLFVSPAARRRGVGELLIEACLVAVRERGAEELAWQTALDNQTAQSLYDRMGARRSQWLDYSLEP